MKGEFTANLFEKGIKKHTSVTLLKSTRVKIQPFEHDIYPV